MPPWRQMGIAAAAVAAMPGGGNRERLFRGNTVFTGGFSEKGQFPIHAAKLGKATYTQPGKIYVS